MSLGGTISYVWATRKLPGGVVGFLMLAMGAVSLSSRYFVNSFIEPYPLQSQCAFTVGMITNLYNGSAGAVVDWPAAELAMQAQELAVGNGGELGVYENIIKALAPDNNSYPPIFDILPDPDLDILGSWECNTSSYDIIGRVDFQNITAFDAYLLRLGLQSTSDMSSDGRLIGSAEPIGFLSWSTEDVLPSNQSQQSLPIVRVSITDGLNKLKPGEDGTVSTLKCVMKIDRQDWIPPVLLFENSTVLQNWTLKAVGNVIESDPKTWPISMEFLLNSMVMAAGAGNIVDAVPSIPGTSYGCRVSGTLVRWEMWLITALLLGTFGTLVVLDLYGLWFYRRNSLRTVVEQMPADVVNWQVAMIRQMTKDSRVTEKEIKSYRYGLTSDGRRLEIRGNGITNVSAALPPWPCNRLPDLQGKTFSSVILTQPPATQQDPWAQNGSWVAQNSSQSSLAKSHPRTHVYERVSSSD